MISQTMVWQRINDDEIEDMAKNPSKNTNISSDISNAFNKLDASFDKEACRILKNIAE